MPVDGPANSACMMSGIWTARDESAFVMCVGDRSVLATYSRQASQYSTLW